MNPLNALAGLPAILDGRPRRVSSNEQPNWCDGNMDMTWLQPGETLELPLLEGPGIITHFWFTSHAAFVGELNALSLRIYWDGADEAAVEVPLGDFFAVGQGRPAAVASFPVQVSPTGSLTCYWPMPFAKSARIVIRNDNMDRSTGLYWQVDWMQLDTMPDEALHFHARYRQEHPAVMGRDYLVADLEGSGRYVGTVLSVTLAQDGWFGEGDDFWYLDGEEVPSLQGTGTEDYFNDAWGYRERTSLWFGQPRWQGDRAGDSGVCYRWHVLDPVPFRKSLKLTLEHKGNRPESSDAFFVERPDFWSSVAFWYHKGAARAWEPLPAWPERCVPWETQHLVRTYRAVRETAGEAVHVSTAGFFGGRPALVWQPRTPGDTLELPFTAPADGRYAVRLTAFPSPTGGEFTLLLDEEQVGDRLRTRGEDGDVDFLVGAFHLEKGAHRLRFKPTGTGPLALEMLRLLKLPPEARRTLRGHNEAHFVLLAIGHAAYAYRLAYGEPAQSLQVLVDAGLLEPRCLNDENGIPLQDRFEEGTLVFESVGAEPWVARRSGADARR